MYRERLSFLSPGPSPQERIKGSHHISSRDGVDEILNLQAVGSKAKPYQVKQVRDVILNYGLANDEAW